MTLPLEIVDIVNKQNQVIGRVPKEEAHQKGLLHRCIISQVIDSQGSWTLVKQASDRQDPGQLVSPVGGHIQAGEAEEDALARETMEELGLIVEKCKFVGRAIFNREVIGRKENHYFIFYEMYTDLEPSLNHESVEYEKFSPAQLRVELFTQPQKFGDAFTFGVKMMYPYLLERKK